MKYVFNGLYRQYRGYVFAQGHPVDVTDSATLELIKREPDFQPYEEKPDEKAQIQAPDPAPVLKGKECSVCHKLIPRGWYMHQKYCKNAS